MDCALRQVLSRTCGPVVDNGTFRLEAQSPPLNASHQAKEVVVDGSQASTLTSGGVAGGGEEANGEPVTTPTRFTLSAGECLLVRELFAWLVEPCLAFLRREISEMVRKPAKFKTSGEV